MSRIGKKPIIIPEGVNVKVEGGLVTVKGPKGELARKINPDFSLAVAEGEVACVPQKQGKNISAQWGLWRSLVANMISGVSSGYQRKLEMEGIGYRVSLDGKDLVLSIGFSHPVRYAAPAGINFAVEKNVITVSGIDKELVGDTAAQIRSLKKPEPYKGKGIRYQGEVIRRKVGKKGVSAQ